MLLVGLEGAGNTKCILYPNMLGNNEEIDTEVWQREIKKCHLHYSKAHKVSGSLGTWEAGPANCPPHHEVLSATLP